MSGLLVLQLSTEPCREEDLISFDALSEDELYNMRTDYDNEPRSLEEVKRWVQDEFGPFASVDAEKRTVTFHDRKTVRRAWKRALLGCLRRFLREIRKGKTVMGEYHLRRGVAEPFDFRNLLYYDGYCHNASTLVAEYLEGAMPRTLFIGSVLEGHC